VLIPLSSLPAIPAGVITLTVNITFLPCKERACNYLKPHTYNPTHGTLMLHDDCSAGSGSRL
jgi:hypothetical protein